MAPRADAPPGIGAALRRSRTLRVAGVAWLLLFVLVAANDGGAAGVPGWFAWGLATLLLPAVVLAALVALPLLPFARTRRAGIVLGALLATFVALLWALVVGVGLWWFGGPYGLIPWLGPGSVADFARRHPALSVSTLPIDTMVRDAAGRAVQMHPLDLAHAEFAFEPCDAPPLADRLGGLPPPPLPCIFRYRIARDGHLLQVHVHEEELPRRAAGTDLPYSDWARARGAGVGLGGGGLRGTELELRGAERTWHVRVVHSRYRQRVLIAEGGGPLRLPDRH